MAINGVTMSLERFELKLNESLSSLLTSKNFAEVTVTFWLFTVPDTPVIQVRARDRDADIDPNNPAGKIEYSIVSTHKHFKIDPVTGWLSTNKVSHRKPAVYSC